MAYATDWLRSNRQKEPSREPGGLFTKDIDLVKLPSEAVGSQREDSRAAAHLFSLRAVQSQRAMMHRLKLKCNSHSLPSHFLLDTDIPGSTWAAN